MDTGYDLLIASGHSLLAGTILTVALMGGAWAIVVASRWGARRAIGWSESRSRVLFWLLMSAIVGSALIGGVWAYVNAGVCRSWAANRAVEGGSALDALLERSRWDEACDDANRESELRYDLAVGIVIVASMLSGVRARRAGSEHAPVPRGGQDPARRGAEEEPSAVAAVAPPRRPEKMYDISSLVRYWALSEWGTSRDLWYRCYVALCRAYEVPPGWEADQRQRSRAAEWRDASEHPPVPLASNLEYASHRRRFAELDRAAFWSSGVHESGELGERIHLLMGECYDAARARLLALDAAFFAGVYGADTERVFGEAELVARFGMPTTAAQQDEWMERF